MGILGGGQLGRMLLQKAADFNLTTAVLDPDPDAPCRHLTGRFVTGDFNDYETVLAFGRQVDVLTVEIEHVHVGALEILEQEGKPVFPQPRILKMVQDKGSQKIFYRTHAIPTAEFHLVESKEQIPAHAGGFPFMQKMRRGGYDGRGVVRLMHAHTLDQAFDVPSVLEKLVPFEKEVSVIVARNEHGEARTFPPVEMQFNPEANLVEFLFAPAALSEAVQRQAEDIALRLAEALGLVGVLAVEMFVLPGGEVLVNEIAPRPHNSGHHTIEANVTSQYEQHLRAVLGLPLGDTRATHAAVMLNLLGEKGYEGPARYSGLDAALALDGVKLHLYGKKMTRPFRKMGHVTVVGNDVDTAARTARKVQELLKIIA